MSPLPLEITSVVWLVFLIVWFVSALFTKKGARSPQWSRLWIVRMLVIVFFYGAIRSGLLNQYFRYSFPMNWQWFGTILTILGIGIAFWARYYLGRNWGTPMSLKENPELVTSGPYAYVRHPIYSGVLLAMLGFTFVIGLGWLVIIVVSLFIFIHSMNVEEKNMQNLFPNVYPAYKLRTKRIIPFIY